MATLLQDIRFAVRSLRKSPGFTAVAVLTLALGIGATATIYTWMDALVLRPFPTVRDAGELVRINTRQPGGFESNTSYPDYLDWRDQAQSFAGLAAYSMAEFGLNEARTEGPAQRVWGVIASDNYFEVLGVRPLLGRTFLPDEATPGSAPVAVISHTLWQHRFSGDPAIVGRPVELNGQNFTIVGVAPPRFGGTMVGLSFDLWVPIATLPLLEDGTARLEWRLTRWLNVFGRLRPGASLAQTRLELAAIGARIEQAHPETRGTAPWAVPFDEDGGAQQMLRPVLSILLGVTALVLLIACANVTNLLLARATARRREIGIRLALGAGRGRLIQQLLTESFVLALLGGLLAIAFAWYGRDLIASFVPLSPFPIEIAPTLNARVLAVATGLMLLTTLIFGLVPALRASRPELVSAIKGDAPGWSGGGRLRGGLVSAQVALALVALVSAGLFLRTLQQAQQVDPGFRDPARVLLVSTNLQLAGFRDREAEAQLLMQQLVEQAQALPGVQAAAVATTVPLGFGGWNTYTADVEGYQPQPSELMSFLVNRVGAGYFDLMGIPLVRGRALGSEDRTGAPHTVVVNEAFARRFWPGQNPIGRRIGLGSRWLTVVGVAADGKYDSLTDPTPPFIFLPFAQWYGPEITLHLRTAGDPAAVIAPLRQQFAAVDAGLPFLDPRTLEEHMGAAVILQRLAATLLAAFAALALLLAVVGLYGVVAYMVVQRTREIGIRMALGAAGGDVIRAFLREGARLTAIGLLLGLGGAMALAQLLRSQLFGVGPADPLSFGAAAVLLTGVALLASYLPARRATRVDPLIALRTE